MNERLYAPVLSKRSSPVTCKINWGRCHISVPSSSSSEIFWNFKFLMFHEKQIVFKRLNLRFLKHFCHSAHNRTIVTLNYSSFMRVCHFICCVRILRSIFPLSWYFDSEIWSNQWCHQQPNNILFLLCMLANAFTNHN